MLYFSVALSKISFKITLHAASHLLLRIFPTLRLCCVIRYKSIALQFYLKILSGSSFKFYPLLMTLQMLSWPVGIKLIETEG